MLIGIKGNINISLNIKLAKSLIIQVRIEHNSLNKLKFS